MTDKKDSKAATLGVIILFILFGIFALLSVMMMFLALGIADEAKKSMPPIVEVTPEEYLYNGRLYHTLSDDTGNVRLAHIDFPDLGVERLKFVHSDSEIEKGKVFEASRTKRYLSMIDDIEQPTKEYIIHYDIWSSKYKFIVDRKEKAILESYDGDIVIPELDYGGQGAYRLGEQLVIRCDDKNLLVLHCDTSTPNLFETETCAEFMRTEMELPKRLNAFDLLAL